MSRTGEAALAYHEPTITTILIQSSFLILLNVLNWALDSLLYCGLIGQILVGIAWGTPGAGLLTRDAEDIVVQLGYLGLILMVFEGGLSTSFPSLRANIALSVGVAATGVCVPIGLSFILVSLTGASKLQCFAAGAALCSTSLGTTFAVLRASGLASTRLGVVLTSAAMLDDVVGLVMVQVISNLGASDGSISAVAIVRPIMVSVAFAVVAGLLCRFIVRPATTWVNNWRMSHRGSGLDTLLVRPESELSLSTFLLIGLVTAASYAGTSNLLASYIAGAVLSWWHSEVPHVRRAADRSSNTATRTETDATNTVVRPIHEEAAASAPQAAGPPKTISSVSTPEPTTVFDHYFRPALKWVLQPFFFASIGLSIPITKMFVGRIVWRGVIYASLMTVGKLACGLWLIRFPNVPLWLSGKLRRQTAKMATSSRPPVVQERNDAAARAVPERIQLAETQAAAPSQGDMTEQSNSESLPTDAPTAETTRAQPTETDRRNAAPSRSKPLSLYPAAILGLAMMARGEIGFLVSAIAQSNGVLGDDGYSTESDLFLIVTWAIVLCTVVGPLCVGLLVRRVERLEDGAKHRGAGTPNGALGVWGIKP